MCSASPSKSPKNILLLGNMSVNLLYQSEPVKISFLNDNFLYTIVEKDTRVEIGCLRERADPAVEPDAGYALLFHFTAIGFNEPVKTAKMPGNEDYAGVEFLLTRPRETSIDEGCLFKVVVKMVEYDDFQGPASEMNRKYKHTIERVLTYFKDKVPNMCYLLKKSATDRLVTGRQDEIFASEKTNMIGRASMFSDRFVDYFRAKEEGRLSKADFEKMDDVLNAVFGKRNLSSMFLIASHLGLDFLKEVAVDCMIEKVEVDKDLAIDILSIAEELECERLVDKAADCFVQNFKEVTSSDKWKHFTKELNFRARCVIHTVYVRLSTKELHIPSGLKK